MYVCGITPYDATHLGHASTFLTFDLLHRALLDDGVEVTYVQNVTDVDEPLLQRARARGQDWAALAAGATEAFRADMAALRVLPPDHLVGMVESMSLVVDLLTRLRERGVLYAVDGDFYLDVSAVPRFGSLARAPEQVMREEFEAAGGDPARAGKRTPLDPILWRAVRSAEPAWASDLGRGRPGWHAGCVAVATRFLGESFDVQGGGRDLIYPHHDVCSALSYASGNPWPYARAYLHTGMVGLHGRRMSKSEGNLVLVGDLLRSGADPMALRVALLDHHYETDWEWHPAELDRAATRLARWRAAASRQVGPSTGRLVRDIRTALGDDLDAPAALRSLDEWSEEALAGLGDDESAPASACAAVDALLGVELLG